MAISVLEFVTVGELRSIRARYIEELRKLRVGAPPGCCAGCGIKKTLNNNKLCSRCQDIEFLMRKCFRPHESAMSKRDIDAAWEAFYNSDEGFDIPSF